MATVKTLTQRYNELSQKKAALSSRGVMLCSKVNIKDPVARQRRFDEIAYNMQREQSNIDMQIAKIIEQKNKLSAMLNNYSSMIQQNAEQIAKLKSGIEFNRKAGKPVAQLTNKANKLQMEIQKYQAECKKIMQKIG